MAEPWAVGTVLLVLALGLPGLALFLTWPESAEGDLSLRRDALEDTEPTTRTRAGALALVRRQRTARVDATDAPDAFDAERSLVALGVPVSVFTIVAELLARTGTLSAGTVWIYAVFAAIVATIGIALNRRRVLGRLRASGQWRRRLERLPAAALVLAAASAQIAIVLSRTDSLVGPTSWYYWQQSVAIAKAGRIPATSLEWGQQVRFFDYHLGFNSLSAAIVAATSSVDSLVGAQLVRALVACSAVVGMWLFARVWGAPRYAAAAAAIAVPTVAIFAVKLTHYAPEGAAYLLALASAALLHRWFVSPRRLLAAAVLVTFAGVTQIHTPGAIVAAALCAATAAAHARWSWRWLVRALAVGLALFAVFIGVDLVTGHRGPFSPGFNEAPSLSVTGLDPTYEFAQLATAGIPADRSQLGAHPPGGGQLLRKSLTQGFLAGGRPSYWVFMGLLASTLVAAVALRRWMIVRYMVTAAVFVGLLAAISVMTQVGSDTYVPTRSGYSRLFQFWWFVPLAGVSLIARLVPRAWYRIAVSAVLLVICGGLWIRSLEPTRKLGRVEPSRSTLEQLRALPLEPGSLVLSNAFTQDFVEYNTAGEGLTDGRAPYLEARLLTSANTILRRASAFFADPARNPFPWDEYRVKYVLVSTVPNALGNSAIYRTKPALLDKVSDLTRASAGDGWLLYKVNR